MYSMNCFMLRLIGPDMLILHEFRFLKIQIVNLESGFKESIKSVNCHF